MAAYLVVADRVMVFDMVQHSEDFLNSDFSLPEHLFHSLIFSEGYLAMVLMKHVQEYSALGNLKIVHTLLTVWRV